MRHSVTDLVIFLLIVHVRSQKANEGDLCTLEKTGESGKCILIFNCPGSIEGLQKRIIPQTCGFSGGGQDTTPLVCCVATLPVVTERPAPMVSPASTTTTNKVSSPIEDGSKQTSTPLSVTSESPAPMVSLASTPTTNKVSPIGAKSKQKCEEYGKYVFVPSAAVGGLYSDAPDDDECALGEVENIVNGKRAKPKEFPHMALLGFEGDKKNEILWKCGGSLITDKFVLTASHCLYNINFGNVKYVRLGDLAINSNFDDADPQDFTVAKTYLPPEFKPTSNHRDIALLELNERAELNPYVRPACLNLKETLTNNLAVATGWGLTSDSGDPSLDLLKVTLQLFSYSECSAKYSNNKKEILEETQICAGSRNDTSDTCQGDSGGPLQILSSSVHCSYEIIGVTSYGKRCGTINTPAVYVKVSAFIKWIEDTVWPDVE